MAGFTFCETMSGTYTREGKERPFAFQATAAVDDIVRFSRDRKARLTGFVDADGLAANAPMEGELLLDPILGQVIGYRFDFKGADGKRYEFAGEKNVKMLNLVESMTTLPGQVKDDAGNLVAEAKVFFNLKDLLAFLGSFRPRL